MFGQIGRTCKGLARQGDRLDGEGRTAVYMAAREGNVGAVRALIEAGARGRARVAGGV